MLKKMYQSKLKMKGLTPSQHQVFLMIQSLKLKVSSMMSPAVEAEAQEFPVSAQNVASEPADGMLSEVENE